ncbi:MAG: thioredoxin family protein [Butyricimonas faecihominis]
MSGQRDSFFEGSLDQALEVAKKEGKLVFVDFYADWCGQSKQLAKVFSKDEVGVYYNENSLVLK